MEAFKRLMWSTLAAVFLWFFHRMILGFVYPYGGGEYHSIFAYSSGGRIDDALGVYVTYIVVALGLAALLIWRRYPATWPAIALAA